MSPWFWVGYALFQLWAITSVFRLGVFVGRLRERNGASDD